MASRHEARDLLLEGRTPQEIAERKNVTLNTISQYLCTLVGEGHLLHSDIAFKIKERQLIEDVISKKKLSASVAPDAIEELTRKVSNELAKRGHFVDPILVHLYMVARDPRSDLYKLICNVEIILHRFVRRTLETEYSKEWWKKGVPEATRKSCQVRKEEDPNPIDDPYHYTTVIDLKDTIDRNWKIFAPKLPKPFGSNKQDFLREFQRFSEIRNRVMHPVKPMKAYEDDYRFIRNLLTIFS